MKIITIPGDGIGPEIMESTISVLSALNLGLEFDPILVGEQALEKTGELVSEQDIQKISSNRIVLKSPLNTPSAKGFSSVNVFLRKKFDLFVNYRPAKSFKGIKTPFENVDIIVLRENTQGMYSGKGQVSDGNEAQAVSYMNKSDLIKFFTEGFTLFKKLGRKKICLVHKANILKTTSGLFLTTGQEVADKMGIKLDTMIVDATAMSLVKDPSQFDTIITSNLFGDILSDLCAGLVGGLGVAPGANLGTDVKIYEAVHGTAPLIAGKGIANPTALLLSACLMLEDLGFTEEAEKVRSAIKDAISEGNVTGDLGGKLNTKQYTEVLIKKL